MNTTKLDASDDVNLAMANAASSTNAKSLVISGMALAAGFAACCAAGLLGTKHLTPVTHRLR